MKINLLDHGHVRLVEHMGSDLSIVRNARVSYDAEWRSGEDEGKDAKLINYLVRNGHTSPFECVCFTFDVKAPIFVFRQWHRHRTWGFNEVSARYSKLPAEMYVPLIQDMGKQSTSNKQMRNIEEMSNEDIEIAAEILEYIKDANEHAYTTYEYLIDRAVPREIARGVLPLNTFSHMFATVDLHNLMHFIKLRSHEHAQYEIQIYANAMLELIKDIVPVTVEAMLEHYGI
jgi:thymidylate synthase (FAD)